jgi:hypothetical protein
MKKTIKNVMTFCALLYGLSLNGQNQIWPVGNQQWSGVFGSPHALPTPSGPDVYEGQQAKGSHNAYHNPVTGELLFFIIDGVIYDHEGYIIDDLSANSATGQSFLGFAETVIVPDPGNCTRYYIFTSSWPYTESPSTDPKAQFAVLDLSLPRTNFHQNRMGAMVENFIPGQNSIAYN